MGHPGMRWLVVAGALALGGCGTLLTPAFGVRQGNLAGCPSQQDCVSTQDRAAERYIAPLIYKSSRAQAHSDLISAIRSVGEARIVSNHRNYLRVEYPTMNREDQASEYYYQPENAVDEVEFYLVPGQNLVEMRSVARLGLLDLGANRARLEKLRTVFEALQQQPH